MFREYDNNDKDLLLDFIKKLSQNSKDIDPLKRVKNFPGYAELSLTDLLSDVEKYRGKIWFAQDDETVIGYVIGAIWEQNEKNKLEIGPHTLGEVLELFVEEKYRGQGIGTKMLAMMEDYFKEKQCDSMWISVFAPNNPAHELYEKFGFTDRDIGMLKNI
jgi:ribosomal protein S18 acetylase RimI-like enzyme